MNTSKPRAIKIIATNTAFYSSLPEGWYVMPLAGGLYWTPDTNAPRSERVELLPPSGYGATDMSSARWIVRYFEDKNNGAPYSPTTAR
jgi:hypothetical protein